MKPDAFHVVEMDLQGVHPKQEKFHWRGAGLLQPTALPQARAPDGLREAAFEPQRLRTFKITYNKAA